MNAIDEIIDDIFVRIQDIKSLFDSAESPDADFDLYHESLQDKLRVRGEIDHLVARLANMLETISTSEKSLYRGRINDLLKAFADIDSSAKTISSRIREERDMVGEQLSLFAHSAKGMRGYRRNAAISE